MHVCRPSRTCRAPLSSGPRGIIVKRNDNKINCNTTTTNNINNNNHINCNMVIIMIIIVILHI